MRSGPCINDQAAVYYGGWRIHTTDKMINTFHKKISQARVGLALGSGSARGWAHIGVIRALAESGARVDYVAGTSIGALVGAVYASGEIDTLEEVVL
ncbi:MAG TPA: hypothetical protein ENK36_08835 [Desulfobacterales bacterium]|nr:hypothetical protein [Desulfobacterales bacterium]